MFVKVAVVLVGALLLLQYVNGQTCICKCGPSGLFGEEDLCAKHCSGPLVVRPKPLTKPTITLPLFGGSNKGPCYRRQAIVKPAVVPRPVYVQGKVCTQTCNGNSNLASAVAAAAQLLAQSASCTSSTSHTCSNTISHQAVSHASGSAASYAADAGKTIDISRAYEQIGHEHASVAPADAVSLALAYKQAQNSYNRKVSEDRLSYGFRKLPIDLPCPKAKTYKHILPEESLYTLNGQVVELKPVTEANCAESLSEEAQDELLDLAISEEHLDDYKVAKRPSLYEIGYGPAKINSATFIDVPAVTPKLPVPSVTPAAPCNDGFKSGTVEYRDYAKEYIADVNGNGESCESQEEAVRHIAVPRPTCHCNYDGNVAGLVKTFATALKTSSSSCAAHKKSVVFQKLCA